MKNVCRLLLKFSILCLVPCLAHAQTPPKVLLIQREWVKPGKTGEVHDKSESAFVQAFAKAKWPTNYLGMTSLSGKSRALFLTFYPSFDAWQKDVEAQAKDATLSAAIDHANAADGELLDSMDQGVFVYEDQLSLRPKYADPHRHALEISVYHVKPGHLEDWNQLVKLVRDGYEKAVPEAHWAVYRLLYGGAGGTYIVLTGHQAATEIDASFDQGKQFISSLGELGLRRLGELERAAVESSDHELFVINPRMSYPPDDYVKADPDFWAPKPEAAAPTSTKKKEKP
jgi:hypothetical protein